ncbi:MAG: dihydroorotase [bacterium]
MRLLICGGKIIDPANGLQEERLDILIADGKIIKIGSISPDSKARVIDAEGYIVVPGLIDMHVHLREPGQEYKETIMTGTLSAAKGGFTSIAAMANTNPVADSPEIIRFVIDKARRDGFVNVFPIGSVTIGMNGNELTDIGNLVKNGAVAVSDDGKPIKDAKIMKLALERSKEVGVPVISHCEFANDEWVMNEGIISSRLRVKGISNSAEEMMVKRDIGLAEETGGHLHIAHVSTKGSIELIRQAKKKGIKVTAEATPHHFTLTDESVEKYGANAKMNPPLRSQKDVDSVIAGLADGTIDAIVTDHAPHSLEEKSLGLIKAPFGIVGLETCLPLVITQLVNNGYLTLYEAIAKLTLNPARILNLNKGTITEGGPADITIIDLQKSQVVDASQFESKGKNTPFNGWRLNGWALMTIVNGKIVYENL